MALAYSIQPGPHFGQSVCNPIPLRFLGFPAWANCSPVQISRSYIRSKSDPSIFWYDNDGFIVPSKTQRTKFRVVGKTRSEKDHVIIPTDHISISVVGREDGYVRTDSGVLTTDGSGSDTFVFKDFKHSFLPVGSADDAAIKKVEFDGDEWELVA
jgi:hypothetical protein